MTHPSDTMMLGSWMLDATAQLKAAHVPTARLDCLVLLGDELGHDRAWLLSHTDEILQGSILQKLNTKIVQRASHVPLAYIRGHAEFYGREFIVNEHTLVPRPETETMLELLGRIRNLESDIAAFAQERRGRKPVKKQYAFEKSEPASSLVKTEDGYKVVWQKQKRTSLHQPKPPIVGQPLRYHDEDFWLVDVGTGSGAIAITAKLEMPESRVTALDIDEHCLEVARRNAVALTAEITFERGNLLEPIATLQPADSDIVVLLCNLPYVPTDFAINTAATHEPKLAIFSGEDGLNLYRELFMQIESYAWQPDYILCESLPQSHTALAKIAKAAGYQLQETDDFIQLFTPA